MYYKFVLSHLLFAKLVKILKRELSDCARTSSLLLEIKRRYFVYNINKVLTSFDFCFASVMTCIKPPALNFPLSSFLDRNTMEGRQPLHVSSYRLT